MPDRYKVIKGLNDIGGFIAGRVGFEQARNFLRTIDDAIAMLKEQEAEIRQLRLALDIAKGTCKGIKSGGSQFADMPTMQSATQSKGR